MKKKKVFEPFRCEDCAYGIYDEDSGTWECWENVQDEEECEANYEDL